MDEKDYRAAIENLQKGLATNERNEWLLSRLGVAYALAGDRKQSEEILQGLLKNVKNRGDLAFNIAQIYAVLGERDQAFAWLEKAYQYREGVLILLGNRTEFDAVRQDPRYTDLMRRVGLPGVISRDNAGPGDAITQERWHIHRIHYIPPKKADGQLSPSLFSDAAVTPD